MSQPAHNNDSWQLSNWESILIGLLTGPVDIHHTWIPRVKSYVIVIIPQPL